MLIPIEKIKSILNLKKISVKGVFHVGAHNCEELVFYKQLGLMEQDMLWIDAIPDKVLEAQKKGIPNVFHACITDKDDEEVVFNISNNVHSSSVLELGTHAKEHPYVKFVNTITQNTTTIDTFFEKNTIDASKYNFWNFDIQGVELFALQGALRSIKYVQVIYLEVNEKELYKNCGLVHEIDAFLLRYNFKRILTYMTTHGWGDAIYVLDTIGRLEKPRA